MTRLALPIVAAVMPAVVAAQSLTPPAAPQNPSPMVEETRAHERLAPRELAGLRRTPVLRWGPRGMQQLSEVRVGGFELLGFAGNAAPDHVDQLHGMPEFLERISR